MLPVCMLLNTGSRVIILCDGFFVQNISQYKKKVKKIILKINTATGKVAGMLDWIQL